MSVELRGIVKRLKRRAPLMVDLSIATGEFVALLGRRAPARQPCCASSPGSNSPMRAS
jgi:hypothetical protein